MQIVSNFYINTFDDPKISIAKLISFTTDHLERLTARNSDGRFTDRINATSAALSTLAATYTEDFTMLGFRKAQKKIKRRFRKNLPSAVAKIVASIVGRYGEGAPEVQEAIPQGRTVFRRIKDSIVESHLETLVEAIEVHRDELGPALLDEATQLKDQWAAIHAASEMADGKKSATEEQRRIARYQLQSELFITLLELAKRYQRQPEKAALFMQPHLLGFPFFKTSHRDKEDNHEESIVPPVEPTGMTGAGTTALSSSSLSV